MSLFKRGGVWWTYVYRDGIRHQESTGEPNRRRAKRVEAKLKEELNDLRFQIVETDPHITFEQVAARFIASGSVRPHHLYHLKFLLPFFGPYPALRITKSLTDDFRRERRKHNPAIKPATLNRDLSVLRRILYWAMEEHLLVANPIARLKMEHERRTHRQVLSLAEEDLLLGVARDHLYAMTLIALDTGMRRGEITGQLWSDVDFAQKLVYVTRSKTPEGESREIPLTHRLFRFLYGCRKSEGLLIDYQDRPVRIVKRTWKTALKRAGIRHVRFHDLRHTFNTRLMEAEVLREVRMSLMGHSPGSNVHSQYTHIELPVKRDAIRKLEAWVTNQRSQLNKETSNGSSEAIRSESHPGAKAGTQSMEKEDARRSGPGAGRQAEVRDRRDGGGSENEAQAAPEVRRGAKALRGNVGEGEKR